MRAARHDGNHGAVTPPATTTPRLYRRPDIGLLGGVAAGIAEHLHVRIRVVRLAFIGLAFAAGLGVALYGAYLIVVPSAPYAGRGRFPRWVEYVLALCAAAATVAVTATSVPKSGLLVPIVLAFIGGALIWRQASEPERDRLLEYSRTSLATGPSTLLGRVRLAGGLALVVAGAIIVLVRADFTAFRQGLLAAVVTVIGLALISGPWWMRIMTQLSAERSERIRSQERADLAAQVHDSVLQTLALIRRNASSPREVARLARGQERTLRTLLYGARVASGQLSEELRAAAAEVEDDYAVAIDVVVVGDAPVDDVLAAGVAATREALVNAGKHAQVETISLYAEVEEEQVSMFVKDRGVGFEVDDVADDRQGVRGSIIGRVERHGGTVHVGAVAGSGTEIEIRLPRSRS